MINARTCDVLRQFRGTYILNVALCIAQVTEHQLTGRDRVEGGGPLTLNLPAFSYSDAMSVGVIYAS